MTVWLRRKKKVGKKATIKDISHIRKPKKREKEKKKRKRKKRTNRKQECHYDDIMIL